MIGSDVALWTLLVLGGIASVVLVGVSASAYLDRRSISYLAIVLALCALSGKALVGGLSMVGVLAGGPHHLLEHGLDLLSLLLLVVAIYYARRASPKRDARVPTEAGAGGTGSAGNREGRA